jgi:hypothetical protein
VDAIERGPVVDAYSVHPVAFVPLEERTEEREAVNIQEEGWI